MNTGEGCHFPPQGDLPNTGMCNKSRQKTVEPGGTSIFRLQEEKPGKEKREQPGKEIWKTVVPLKKAKGEGSGHLYQVLLRSEQDKDRELAPIH